MLHTPIDETSTTTRAYDTRLQDELSDLIVCRQKRGYVCTCSTDSELTRVQVLWRGTDLLGGVHGEGMSAVIVSGYDSLSY